MMEKNEQTRELILGAVEFESATLGKFWLVKPKVREFTGYLDLIRRLHAAQQAAGGEFDPAGESDLALVAMSARDDTGAKVFTDTADVEKWLAAGEIVSAAMMVNRLIHPERPTTAP